MSTGRLGAGDTAIQPTILDAKGDLIVATAADTPARLAVGTNEQRLVADSTVATGLKYVADTTNYAIAAKGDLLVGTAADTVSALTVGSTNQVLTVDSTTATGLKWATPAAGGMTLLSTTDLSGSTSITVSNISQDYTNLFILLNNAVKPNGTGDQEYYVIPNNTTNAAGTVREANTGTSFQADNIKFANSSPQTDQPRTYFLTIHNYASTTAYKTFIGGGIQRNADNTQWEGVSVTGGLQSNNAITSLVVSSGATNWSGGQLLIYGVK